MADQLDLLEYARARRDLGMDRAAEAQGKPWAEIAYAAIERVARRQLEVHVDDVLAEGVPTPRHYNAWGAIWVRAIKNATIQRTNQTRLCATDKRKNAHRYPIYRSLIFGRGSKEFG